MKPIKLMIEADMEGASGITHLEQVVPGTAEWQKAREYLTEDINSAVRGIYSAAKEKGIESEKIEITVVDSHWAMNNIILENLDSRVKQLLRGIERIHPQLEGINNSVSGIIAIGNHDQTPTENSKKIGLLSHTWLPGWVWKINKKEVSETILNAYVAGSYGVPIILISGDDVITGKVKEFYLSKSKNIETVCVKEALGLQTGSIKPLRRSFRDIELAAHLAFTHLLKGKYRPIEEKNTELRIKMPRKKEIMIAEHDQKNTMLKGEQILNDHYADTLKILESQSNELKYSFLTKK